MRAWNRRAVVENAIGRSITWIANLFVLAILLGIGWWGHKTHWRIPKFAELTRASALHNSSGDSKTETSSKSLDETQDQRVSPSQDVNLSAHEKGSTAFPLIRFSSAEAVKKAGISTAPVEERHMDEFVTAYGTVSYDETRLAQLSCRTSGIVWRVEKKIGDPVKKGDILAILDSSEVGNAKADFLDADVDYDLKLINLQRLQRVSSSVSERQLRETDADVRKARVRRFNAQQKLINLGLSISIEAISHATDEELARKIHFLGLPPELVATLDAETVSANLIPLVSPLEGIVIKREVVPGEVVEPSRTQFVVADVRKMWLLLNVRKADAGELVIGQEIQFSLNGLPDEIPSKVTWIATEVDPKTRNVQVRAEVENRLLARSENRESGQWLLRSNMYGSGRIRVRQRSSVLVVPSSALQWDGSQHLVFVPEEDGCSFRPQRVELGVIRNGYSEIRGGVTMGQTVVSAGSFLLKSELIGIKN